MQCEVQSGPKVCIKETSPGVTVPEDMRSAKSPALKGDYNSIYFHAASSDMRLKIEKFTPGLYHIIFPGANFHYLVIGTSP